MRHLSDHLDEAALLDAAEDTRPEHGSAHLASCERCRAQVAELRATMRAAEDVSVPEPSPLFWDHLSARVRQAIADDAAGASTAASSGWTARLWSWQSLTSAAAVAVVVVGVAIGLRSTTNMSAPVLPPPVSSNIATGLGDLTPSVENDPSLSFIADLASDLDWDDAVEAGLTGGAGSVDRVVLDMSDDERRELQRVLQEAIGRPGA